MGKRLLLNVNSPFLLFLIKKKESIRLLMKPPCCPALQNFDYGGSLHDQTESFVKVGSKAQIELIQTLAVIAEKLEAIITAENDVRNLERYLRRCSAVSGGETPV
jgi:hypothetical protein